ncbi:DUF7064 domain-containing protein [Pseudoxanthomonas winnipegensis]|uniref:DUF7064 domain-containing protein n=1 Tax=Pseudoxanthomonas winnipegensis TaxID=2480810 RepID=UPI00102DB2F4|nr:hypothetical protein [Pseudoxanthomonas winnipegensis]RZZ88463.1 hypothetical protein EA663_06455 [Pseudoxanthomonas winnipegensis]
MIKPEDARFHAPDADKPLWAETNYFGFYNAQRGINIGVYALFRTHLRTVNSSICVSSRFAVTPWEADYVDWQASIPMPADCDLLDYRLPNGLRVKTLEPNMAWHIRFDDADQLKIDVTYRAIMPPFDIHDPEQDPMVAAASAAGKFAWGTAYNGHFDQSGHFEGQVVLRGEQIPIDCVSTMDHSWGPRPERGAPNMSWLHAHVSKDLAVHAIFGFDPAVDDGALSLTHGYVVERGQVFGFKAGKGKVLRKVDRYADTVELELTDSEDRVWKLRGKGMTSFPWQCYANTVGFNVLARWDVNGEVGYGELQEFFELPALTRLNADARTRRLIHA